MLTTISKSAVVCLAVLGSICTSNAQDFKEYRWKNRLVLILSKTHDHPMVNKQLKELSTLDAELSERKLLVFHLTPDTVRLMLPESSKSRMAANKSYDKYTRSDASFEVLLIGLDGGIKMREKKVVEKAVLFNKIDGMPMRRAEMRKKGW